MRKNVLLTAIFLSVSATAYAQTEPKEGDNGTDPTKLSNGITIAYDYDNLHHNIASHTLFGTYSKALPNNYSLKLRVPLQKLSNVPDAYEGSTSGLGDVSIKVNKVVTRNRSYGIVVGAELAFNTATDDVLGAGKNVLKLSGTYAKFLSNNAIFAPSLVHNVSLWGDRHRSKVNSTTADFYYVPKIANKKYFVTLDPAVTHDWESDKTYGSFSVSLGMQTGPIFGGNSQMYLKPQVLFGADRPSNWGVEVGYKVIGF